MTATDDPVARFTDWLRAMVAQQVGVAAEDIDPEASLMVLGIDSMATIGICGEVAMAIDREVSLDLLWECESIGELARHLHAEGMLAGCIDQLPAITRLKDSPLDRRGRHPLVVTLQSQGDGVPLFILPVAAGTAGAVVPLGVRLGFTQPVYALRLPPDPLHSIEALAAALIDGIRSVQRRGPYRLLGICYGGVLAFEVARQLVAQSEGVAQLVMLDAPFPFEESGWERIDAGKRWQIIWVTVWRYVQSIPGRIRPLALAIVHGEPGVANRVRLGLGEVAALLVAAVSPRHSAAMVTPKVQYLGDTGFERHNIALLAAYRPQPATLRALYVQTAFYRLHNVAAEKLWPSVIMAGIRFVPVESGHSNWIESHLEEVATVIQSDAAGFELGLLRVHADTTPHPR